MPAEKELDVYRDWLGITETQRPLNYYQLLRLKPFDDNMSRIRDRYQKMNAHVRKYATGDYAKQSQQLLNELAKALLSLTDAQRKREYDASLGRADTGPSGRRTLEEILLADKAIDQAQLTKARTFAAAVGLETRDALIQQKLAAPELVAMAYAESLGLPYIELADVGVDETLAPQVPPLLARQHSCVPVMIDKEQLLMASPNPLVPDVEEELRLRFNMPVRTVLCTAASVNAMVAKYYPRDAAAPVAAPVKKGADKPAAAAPKPAAEPAAPRLPREEQLRQRAMIAVVAFNVAVILSVIVFSFIRTGGMSGMSLLDFVIVVVFGGAAAGAAFVVSKKFVR